MRGEELGRSKPLPAGSGSEIIKQGLSQGVGRWASTRPKPRRHHSRCIGALPRVELWKWRKGAAVASRAGQLSILMRTLGRRLKEKLGLEPPASSLRPSPRLSAVEKVSRNALLELVARAKSHPQRGDSASANPAYVALAELTDESERPGLALGLRYETGEITFLDLGLIADKIEEAGDAFVARDENFALWRRLEELIYQKVDSTMVGPRKPVRAPEEVNI